MDIYRPICKHIVTPLWAAWERSPYLKILSYLLESQYDSPEAIKERQALKLRQMVDHAYMNTDFYRAIYDKFGVSPADIRDLNDIRKLPVITKQQARDNSTAMVAKTVPIYRRYFTSGSTGKPMKGYWDKYACEFKRACTLRSMLWSGFEIGERIWSLYGNPYEEMSRWVALRCRIRNRLLNRTRFLDLLRVRGSDLHYLANLARRANPALIWGHTHGLYLFASYLLDRGIDFVRPVATISAGMPVHDFERERIEKAFDCLLLNRYGCEEFGLLACECPEQTGLHINVDSVIMECVDADDQPVPSGHPGTVLVTDLHNHAKPLIRYHLEDIVRMSGAACSCGRSQPLIESIEGRTADFLYATSGEMVSGISLTDHFIMGISGLAQIQIIQDALDHLIINAVKDAYYTQETNTGIAKAVSRFLGRDMKFDIIFLDEIPRERSGKYRFTISKINHHHF